MRYDKSDALLANAFKVIARYDPKLYERMSADGWSVSTDYGAAFSEPAIWTPRFMRTAANAFGTTLSEDDRAYFAGNQGGYVGPAEVFLNTQGIREWATGNDVPVELFAADVLAHEYRHIHQPSFGDNEPPAFRAGSAFATKLPAPYGSKIKRMSDETLFVIKYGQA